MQKAIIAIFRLVHKNVIALIALIYFYIPMFQIFTIFHRSKSKLFNQFVKESEHKNKKKINK